MWIARDKSGKLYLYTSFPEKYETEWNTGDYKDQIEIDGKLFPNLKWEDEPVEVILFPVYYKDYLVKINSHG